MVTFLALLPEPQLNIDTCCRIIKACEDLFDQSLKIHADLSSASPQTRKMLADNDKYKKYMRGLQVFIVVVTLIELTEVYKVASRIQSVVIPEEHARIEAAIFQASRKWKDVKAAGEEMSITFNVHESSCKINLNDFH